MKLIIYIFLTLFISHSYAEITFDGTLGPKVELKSDIKGNYSIEANFGEKFGNNLFHSFDKFNIEKGNSAIFSGPDHIANIIGRITGGKNSVIDGTLVSNANLYLLNPNGIIMGPNASLDIDGSFHLSSADYLRFIDGKEFDTVSTKPILSIESPEAFGFLHNKLSNKIIILGSKLSVKEGNNLSIIGKEVAVKYVKYDGGAIKIQGEEITLENSYIHNGKGKNSNIELKAQRISIKNSLMSMETQDVENGKIDIQADESLEISGTTNGFTGLFTNTNGKGNGGDITIKTHELVVNGNSSITTQTNGLGNGGNITVNVDKLNFTNGGRINASIPKNSEGNSGNITINVADSAKITGTWNNKKSSGIASSTFGKGNSGNISIIVGNNLILNDEATIQTLTKSIGNAGNIYIDTHNLNIMNGADIDASNEGTGQEKGGDINIKATGNVLITAKTYEGKDLEILKKDDGNFLYNNSFGGIYTIAKSGSGGNIKLTTKQLTLRKNATISTKSITLGNAGNIQISTNSILNMENSAITTKAENASGGNITIENPKLFILNKSQILAGAGGGNGGNITIKADNFITSYPYDGDGNVEFEKIPYGTTNMSIINASSKFGLDGKIEIDAFKEDITGRLNPPPKLRQNLKLSLSRCAGGFSKENMSSFITTIKNVSPRKPTDLKI